MHLFISGAIKVNTADGEGSDDIRYDISIGESLPKIIVYYFRINATKDIE